MMFIIIVLWFLLSIFLPYHGLDMSSGGDYVTPLLFLSCDVDMNVLVMAISEKTIDS
jgi:hypothetical protein